MSNTYKTNPWLACPRPNPGACLRLFCFPYSGAGASIFYPWLGHLLTSVEVYPVELPGRGTRLAEPPFDRLEPLVQALAQALLPHLDKPFAFFGHSMGALLSFELARYLRCQHGAAPVSLLVSGHGAPHLQHVEAPIRDLPEDEFLEKVRGLNGTPDQVLDNDEWRQLLLPILRADFAMCETYRYQMDRPLDCPITAFGGLQDEYVSRAQLEAWREQTDASFKLRMFPGDHFFLNTVRPFLLRTIARELDQVMQMPTRPFTYDVRRGEAIMPAVLAQST